MCAFYIDVEKWKGKAYVRCRKHDRYAPQFFATKVFICPKGGDTITRDDILEKEGYVT